MLLLRNNKNYYFEAKPLSDKNLVLNETSSVSKQLQSKSNPTKSIPTQIGFHPVKLHQKSKTNEKKVTNIPTKDKGLRVFLMLVVTMVIQH